MKKGREQKLGFEQIMISVILLLVALGSSLDYCPVCVRHSVPKVAHVSGVSFGSSMMGVVYRAKNKINGKKYIGKTMGSMEERKNEHRWIIGKSRCVFHRALRKYGFDAFEWKVLMREDNEDDLNESEIACIKMLKTKVPNGYNMTDGGEGVSGWNPSWEWRDKNSENHIGKKRSKEAIIKTAEKNRGRKRSKQTCINISESKRGHKLGPQSLEHIAKRVASREGYKPSEETKSKISKTLTGRSLSENTRAKMRKAHKGQNRNRRKKMKVNRVELLRALELVTPALTTKEVIEQSSCFVFRDGKVMTFNDEVAFIGDVPLKEMKGAVQGGNLLALLRKMSEETLEVEVVNGGFTIKGKGRKATIRMEEEVLLPVESVETPEKWKKLPKDFVEGCDIARHCVSTDESQFSLVCVHLHPDHIEACDNFQAIRYPVKTKMTKPILARGVSLQSLNGLNMTGFAETESWLHFRNGDGLVMSCRRYLEDYPKLDGILDTSGQAMTLPGGLAEAVSRADIFSSDLGDENQVTVQLRSGKMRLEGKGPNGSYAEQVKIKYDGEPLKFSISPKLLLEVSRRSNECEVTEGRIKIETDKWTYVSCTAVEEA